MYRNKSSVLDYLLRETQAKAQQYDDPEKHTAISLPGGIISKAGTFQFIHLIADAALVKLDTHTICTHEYNGGTLPGDGINTHNGPLKKWDLNSKHLLQTIDAFSLTVTSSNSHIVAGISTQNSNTVKIGDLSDGRILQMLTVNDTFARLAISANGHVLASTFAAKAGNTTEPRLLPQNIIRVWDLQSGKMLPELEDANAVQKNLVLSADGGLLCSILAGTHERAMKIWETGTGRLLYTLNDRRENNIQQDLSEKSGLFSSDGRFLITCKGHKIRLWDMQQGVLLRSLHYESEKRLSQDAAAIAVPLAAYVYDLTPDNVLATQLQLSLFPTIKPSFPLYCLSQDGRYLLVATQHNYYHLDHGDINRYQLNMWDVQSGQWLRTLDDELEKGITCLALNPDGRTLACGYEDEVIKLWNIQSGQLLQTLEGHIGAVLKLAFSPDGQTLASTGNDSTTRIWRKK